MKTRKLLLIVLVAALALLLSACQINFITEINDNGSGKYIQEIGFQGDEASMAGLETAGENFCADQNQETPPGTSIRQETRNETETWCIYETPFGSLDELKTLYGGGADTVVNDISMVNGKLTYDITLNLAGDSNAPAGAEMLWIVTLPGRVVEHNSTSQEGNTLTWQLMTGQPNNIRAVSENGQSSDDMLLYVLGGGAFLGFCCVGLLVVGGGIFFLARRNKKAAPSAASMGD
ncbi:MAG: LppM family (lipo)protein [Chloroflexota bacterium]